MTNKENLLKINYYNGNKLSSVIWVDYRTNEVEVTNYTDDLVFRAFGVNETPTFNDFEDFLESRCFPKNRDHCKEVLRELGLDFYDPLDIVFKTNGRLAEDDCWLELLEGQNYDSL